MKLRTKGYVFRFVFVGVIADFERAFGRPVSQWQEIGTIEQRAGAVLRELDLREERP